MIWLILAILSTMCFALTQVFDNYYINKIFRGHLISSIFYGHILKVATVFIIFIIFVPLTLPGKLWPYYLIIGVTEILYLLPYYKSLQLADTSIVAALFSLGTIFIPIFAFFTVKEVLMPYQYFGFILILVSSTLLSLHGRNIKLKIDISLLYMFLAVLLLALQAVTYKYIFANTVWTNGYFWSFVFIGLGTIFLLIHQNHRSVIIDDYPHFSKQAHIVLGNVLLSIIAWGGFTYSLIFIDISVMKGIEGMQPFFVMIYALFFKKSFPYFFKEAIDFKSTFKKGGLFIFLLLGVICIVG